MPAPPRLVDMATTRHSSDTKVEKYSQTPQTHYAINDLRTFPWEIPRHGKQVIISSMQAHTDELEIIREYD